MLLKPSLKHEQWLVVVSWVDQSEDTLQSLQLLDHFRLRVEAFSTTGTAIEQRGKLSPVLPELWRNWNLFFHFATLNWRHRQFNIWAFFDSFGSLRLQKHWSHTLTCHFPELANSWGIRLGDLWRIFDWTTQLPSCKSKKANLPNMLLSNFSRWPLTISAWKEWLLKETT